MTEENDNEDTEYRAEQDIESRSKEPSGWRKCEDCGHYIASHKGIECEECLSYSEAKGKWIGSPCA